jgi:hypothetical protein
MSISLETERLHCRLQPLQNSLWLSRPSLFGWLVFHLVSSDLESCIEIWDTVYSSQTR